jgi:alpha/beta hydrolase family protein
MSEETIYDRRCFLANSFMTIAATQLGMPTMSQPRWTASFGPLKQIDAGLLNVGYAEDGPADGRPVILLHGWPYDIYSFADVTPLLAAKGYRVIVPYLRGYGSTRFLSNDTFRNGQPSAVAVDMIALMDALKIQKAILAVSIGGRGRPTLWPRSGPSGVRPRSP